MRKIVLEQFGGPEVLRVGDHPDPELPADGYLIAVRAAALNFADTVERRGHYRRDQSLPYELGKEAAGVVLARGAHASRFQVGDPVIAIKFDNGCYAERVAAREQQVLRPPAGYSFEEMAAFGNAFATAWYALHEVARVRPGESALVQAAAGGVGCAAVQLARSAGCRPVLGTAGGAEKCRLVEGLGASACIDYRSEDLRDRVRELTGGSGVDFCLESVGGEVYEHSLEVLAPLGRMVVIGFSSIREDYAHAIPRLHPLHLLHRSIAVAGLNVDRLDYPRRRSLWERLVAHVEQHGLRPHVGAVFPLEQAAAAHAALEERRSSGKVVLVP